MLEGMSEQKLNVHTWPFGIESTIAVVMGYLGRPGKFTKTYNWKWRMRIVWGFVPVALLIVQFARNGG